jgi:hypothetical protein
VRDLIQLSYIKYWQKYVFTPEVLYIEHFHAEETNGLQKVYSFRPSCVSQADHSGRAV